MSAKLVPRDSTVWFQVDSGPAKGLWLKLNPRTGRHYFEGTAEPEVQQVLAGHLRPGMVFYDIGANLGFFSLLAAKLVGPRGKVVAFEAEPEAIARFREHAARNEFSNISLEEAAVWSHTGEVTFVRSDRTDTPDRGLGYVDPSATQTHAIPVLAIALDDYERQPLPDFLKCDVEGAEVDVFRGAPRMLRQKRPGIICELHSGESRRILTEEFVAAGYACQPCGANHLLALPVVTKSLFRE